MATIEEIIVRLRFEAKQSMKNLQKSGMLTKKLGKVSQKARNELKKLSKTQKTLGTITKQTQRQFAGWALSMMFFGMAIQRVFNGIWKAGQKTFQEIAHSVEGTVTQFDFLNGAVEILKYTIGSALNSVLEPLMPIIWQIVESTSDWISENEKLFGWIVIIGSAIGGAMMAFGMLKLGIDGLVSAFGLLKPAILAFKLTLAGIGTTWILVLIGLVLVFFAIWKTNLGNIQGLFEENFNLIKGTVLSVFNTIKTVFQEVWGFIIDVLNGDWDKAMIHLFTATKAAFIGILRAGVYMSNVFRNIWKFILNSITNNALITIKGLLTSLRGALKYLGIDTSGLNSAISQVEKLKDSLKIDYTSKKDVDNGWEMGLVDKLEANPTVYNTLINMINPSGDEIMEEVKRASNPSRV